MNSQLATVLGKLSFFIASTCFALFCDYIANKTATTWSIKFKPILVNFNQFSRSFTHHFVLNPHWNATGCRTPTNQAENPLKTKDRHRIRQKLRLKWNDVHISMTYISPVRIIICLFHLLLIFHSTWTNFIKW